MSKPKGGLEFDRSQPAFLRRLRGEITSQVDDPDRHVNPVARPQRPKRLDAEDDDGPTYVLEDTNDTLTKEEYEALVKGDTEETGAGEAAEGENPDVSAEKAKPTQKVTPVGAAKKRKVAKLIGADEGDEDEEEKYRSAKKNTTLGKAIQQADGKAGSVEKKPAPKKKKAKVKLDFGDDEET